MDIADTSWRTEFLVPFQEEDGDGEAPQAKSGQEDPLELAAHSCSEEEEAAEVDAKSDAHLESSQSDSSLGQLASQVRSLAPVHMPCYSLWLLHRSCAVAPAPCF